MSETTTTETPGVVKADKSSTSAPAPKMGFTWGGALLTAGVVAGIGLGIKAHMSQRKTNARIDALMAPNSASV